VHEQLAALWAEHEGGIGDTPALAQVARLLHGALLPGVVRLHVDPFEQGLRVRARREDRRLDDLSPVPAECAEAVTQLLEDGRRWPAGFEQVDLRASLRETHYVCKVDPRDRRPVKVRVTPCLGGPAFCLEAPWEEDPASPREIQDQLGEARVGALADATLAAPGGIVAVVGPDPFAVRRGVRQLAARRREEFPLVLHLSPAGAADVPGSHRARTLYGPGLSFWEMENALKQQPDRLLVDPPYSPECLAVAAQGALCGVQVFLGQPALSSAVLLATWANAGRTGELIQHSLRGLLHVLDLPRLCPTCRRPRGDLPAAAASRLAALTRGGPMWTRGGCTECRYHGVIGSVGLRGWTSTGVVELGELRSCEALAERARRAGDLTRGAVEAVREQLARALTEGWIDPVSALWGLDCLGGEAW
jgi:general secretion pathway protein E